MASNVTLRKPCTSIREKILPFPLKGIERCAVSEGWKVFGNDGLLQVGFQSSSPLTKSARIVCVCTCQEKIGRTATLDKRTCSMVFHCLQAKATLRSCVRGV